MRSLSKRTSARLVPTLRRPRSLAGDRYELALQEGGEFGDGAGVVVCGLCGAPGDEAIGADQDSAALGHPVGGGPAPIRVFQISTVTDAEGIDEGVGHGPDGVDPGLAFRSGQEHVTAAEEVEGGNVL